MSHLASGGMAEVYLARASGDGGFARHLVIKAMRPSPGLDGTFARMFLDEARLAATLHHQHIAQVFDLGATGDGSYYLVMEYVHGETVRNVVGVARNRSLPLPPGFGIAVGAAVASALQYAHERTDERGLPLRIVHRDVTPANILVGHDGAVKLIDFGIAKAAARTSNTQTGVVKGKAGYMAPEQVLNERLDARTDVFALGIVLYELTTQERLFAGQTDFESAQRCVQAEVPRPSVVRRGFPPALEDVLLTALARDPERRFPSAGAMGQALVDAAARDGLDAHPTVVERVVGALFGVRREPWQKIAPPRAEDDDDVDEDGTTERIPGGLGDPEPTPASSAALAATTDPGASDSMDQITASVTAAAALPMPAAPSAPVPRVTWRGHAVSERTPAPVVERSTSRPNAPVVERSGSRPKAPVVERSGSRPIEPVAERTPGPERALAAPTPRPPPRPPSRPRPPVMPPIPQGKAPPIADAHWAGAQEAPASSADAHRAGAEGVPLPVISEASQRWAAEPTLVVPMAPVLSLPLRPPEESRPVRDADAHWMDDSEPEAFELPPRLGSVPHRPITQPVPVLRRPRRRIAQYVAVAMLLGAAAGVAFSIAAGGDRSLSSPDRTAAAGVDREPARPSAEPGPVETPSLSDPRTLAPDAEPLPSVPPVADLIGAGTPQPPAANGAIVPGDGRVHVTITTDPPGATVLVDNRRLGRTPFEATIEPRGKQVWLKVRKRGHATRKLKVDVAPAVSWDVRLPRR